ncbi:MAG: cob(I)yrinic acid a,c-diamide adenosyltransferase [Candidatus Edwardsbacteria bacterium RIFOXYD12_FULL_50_11]|uniref:Cob(I)yrinic acid a,c-diamide adenosyltransferase n=1 Tax=Candidatus Edwardsbacteria bacterium GWF2_54_11 TaxID=1817851 RepID=A0A1F5RI42_9BACT|nr:MAG: cob(I)yrinic acid a,c-diamide adenosyltransferase [Candidatus Edwardsbacteria bacterium RifOxyC12_full_54_24]OGF07025.1 MAG: cob(I)yrinic acid a,c-diamide adenosyltransferase [Candidatus Edwardsbacteria bacterium RifOxyA12_full_54_48]OGF11009.1 MAG: cob(I)yrinic acid a,c-diamide adenosyltransferase [Candidatus Edwardsbacteria bacterium GWE2_54_12]OGF14089.1 MAG: cob(I)yrinic acid a,c-diamide adenosyltransferase [Candidatus Edwardsbacteria bacterium GWF2_54_11]OGF15955.1 MAG: cob(I)yrini
MKGMIQVYTGNGKGKTTASLGLALRASGQKKKILMIQFMKGKVNYGELRSAKKLPGFTIKQFGRPSFVDKKNPAPADIKGAGQALEFAQKSFASGKYDIIILDELNVALDFNLVSLKDVLDLIATKPEKVELIITGRYAHPKVIKLADLVSEVKEVKHYYMQGVPARKGIEF